MTRDYTKQTAWKRRAGVKTISADLNPKTDSDLIPYVERKKEEGYSTGKLIKEALREKKERESSEEEKA